MCQKSNHDCKDHSSIYIRLFPKTQWHLCIYLLWTTQSYTNSTHSIYSGISIYRSRNDRFSACTVRNFWSWIKFHINNVIYFRIHRFPNYRFSASIVCKSRSRRSISRVDRLKKKNWSKVFINGFTFSFYYKFANTVIQSRFAHGSQLRVSVDCVTCEP